MLKTYDYKPTYDEVKEYIGGYIEGIDIGNGDRMYVNEDGLFADVVVLNTEATAICGHPIVGNAVIIPKEHCGEDW